MTRQIEGLSQRPELLTQPAKKTDLTSRFFLFLPFLHLQQLNRRLNIYLILREDMRRTVEGGNRQLLQRAHLARLHRFRFNAVHQQADGEHRIFFINMRIGGHLFAVDHV